MVDVTAIRCLRTQFIYMTATLPLSIQAEFEERNYLVCPTTIRASSNRSNIFYMVRKVDHQKGSLLEQTATEVCDAWQPREPPGWRAASGWAARMRATSCQSPHTIAV